MGPGRMVLAFVVAATWCVTTPIATSADADTDTEELPVISAQRLGDADAPEPEVEEDEHYLSPAERDALAAQGYELEIDDRVVTQTRIQPSKAEQEKKGKFGRAMDHVGRGFVAVASVALPIAAAVAPFLLF